MYITNGEKKVVPYIVGTGGVTAGCLAVISSTTAVKGAAAVTDATLLGIACDDYDATELGLFEVIGECTEVTAKFTAAGTKKTFTNADIGKVYDFSDENTINPDDTTGGSAMLIGYDNDVLEATFVVPKAKRYL